MVRQVVATQDIRVVVDVVDGDGQRMRVLVSILNFPDVGADTKWDKEGNVVGRRELETSP